MVSQDGGQRYDPRTHAEGRVRPGHCQRQQDSDRAGPQQQACQGSQHRDAKHEECRTTVGLAHQPLRELAPPLVVLHVGEDPAESKHHADIEQKAQVGASA
jgi:hypothetical protein